MLSEAKYLSEKEAVQFRRALLAWYRRNGRDLPWRRTSDPYAILVSEVMLQQTQVAAVIPYYERWLQRFPSVEILARSSESEVLHAWQGLGYYSRAQNLHRAAQILNDRGNFPKKADEIATLPGAGRYTANAVATFAFNQSVPIVEANIARVLSRLFDLQKPIDASVGRTALWDMAVALLPRHGGRNHNSALMDLGATICSPLPKCGRCPVRTFCSAKNPIVLPVKNPRAREKRLTEFHSFNRQRGRVLLEQSRKRWRGLWTLPSLPVAPLQTRPLYTSEFPFTHHRIKLIVYAAGQIARLNPAQRWFSILELNTVPMPSPHRRALSQLLAAA